MLDEPVENLGPRLQRWPTGRPIVRAHPSEYGATEFDSRTRAVGNRFSPFRHGGRIVGVLYGAADERATASETIFHTVPVPDDAGGEARPRSVLLDLYRSWMWSAVEPRRDLRLISLRGGGLEALGVSRQDLILSDRRVYPRTRRWAAALYQAVPEADGLWWTSRQAPGVGAVLLFDRHRDRSGGVARTDLAVARPPQPFLSDEGLERLLKVALDLDITVLS